VSASRLRAALAVALLLAFAGCDRGDWFGPLERVAREALMAWDMWATDAVRPYEAPMPSTPEGTVPVDGAQGFDEAREQWRNLTGEQRREGAALAYRRYCHHCHGASGDGRIIVGESLDAWMPDLRDASVQEQTNEELYEAIAGGFTLDLPLDRTMTPLEIMLAIDHVRSLRAAPSEPYFKPRSTQPIE
jgi:hypothetical protein